MSAVYNKMVKTKTLLALIWIFALVYWNCIVWQQLFAPTGHNLIVAFLDIGQGDAIFIQAPNGVQMLVDGGEDKDVIDKLKEVMPRLDISIDAILATHADSDHIGGLDDVLRSYDVSNVFDNGRDNKETTTFETFQKEINSEIQNSNALHYVAEHGMRIVLDKEKEVYFDIYYPTASSTSLDSNELSIVGKVVYGETEFMLTGDAGEEVENKLLAWCAACLESDVLKLGHHGSKTSTTQNFLTAVHPAYAIVSAGADNTYGHPSKAVIDRLKQSKIHILETAKSGTIVFESDGREVKLR